MAQSELSPLQKLLGPHADEVKRNAKIMRVRPLIFREFEPAMRAVEGLDRCGRVMAKVTNKTHFPNAKAITAKSLYHYDAFFFEKNDHLSQIAHLNVRMNPIQLTYTARPFPFLADMAHVQLRHIDRGGSVIDYGTKDFTRLLGISLAMGDIVSRQLDEAGEQWMPVAVPEENGLYLGYAQKIDTAEADNNAIIFAARRPQEKGALYLEKTPEWRPSVRIVVNTYVNMDDASGTNRNLYDLFAPFITLPHIHGFAENLVCAFTYGEHWAEAWDTATQRSAAEDARKKLGNSLVRSAPPIRADQSAVTIAKASGGAPADDVSLNQTVFEYLTALLRDDAWAGYVRQTRPKIRPHVITSTYG